MEQMEQVGHLEHLVTQEQVDHQVLLEVMEHQEQVVLRMQLVKVLLLVILLK